MSDFLINNLNQTAVYWANRVLSGDYDISFDDGIEVDVRWEDRKEMFIDVSGQEKESQAVVYVDRDMETGEFLFLGDLDDSSLDSSGAFDDVDSFEIKAFKKSPNFAGDDYARKVFL